MDVAASEPPVASHMVRVPDKDRFELRLADGAASWSNELVSVFRGSRQNGLSGSVPPSLLPLSFFVVAPREIRPKPQKG